MKRLQLLAFLLGFALAAAWVALDPRFALWVGRNLDPGPFPCEERVGLRLLATFSRDPDCALPQLLSAVKKGDPRWWKPWLEAMVQTRRGPGLQRVRAAAALLELGDPEPALAELRSGRLGPRERALLTTLVAERLGPENAPSPWSNGQLEAWGFAHGDATVRARLRVALAREGLRPLGPDWDRGGLLAGALEGLGLDSARLVAQQVMLSEGRASTLDSCAIAALRRHPGERCEGPGAREGASATADPTGPGLGCVAMVVELLDCPVDPAGEEAILGELPPPELERLPAPWDAAIAELSLDPELLAEAAAFVDGDPGRLLGLVAADEHLYTPEAWAAGQRGDPSLALRYGSATPGASAVAAEALGAANRVDVHLYRAGEQVWIRAGRQVARVGPCGAGSGTGGAPVVMLPGEAWELARAELAWGALARGDLPGAHAALEGAAGPDVEAARAAIMACEGAVPEVRGKAAAEAAAAALSCGQLGVARTLAARRDGAEPTRCAAP